jgi:hypothetical protein
MKHLSGDKQILRFRIHHSSSNYTSLLPHTKQRSRQLGNIVVSAIVHTRTRHKTKWPFKLKIASVSLRTFPLVGSSRDTISSEYGAMMLENRDITTAMTVWIINV